MKRIFIFLLILSTGKITSQVLSETFNNGTPTNSWDLSTNGDFAFQSSATIYTVCNVVGSSGNGFLAGEDFSGGPEEAKLAFSTAGWGAMTIQWNGLRQPGAPAVTLEMSTDDITYTPIAFTDVAADGLWHTVTAIPTPGTYDNDPTVFLKLTYTSTGGNSIVAFDDINITGTGSPLFYWDGSGPLQNLTSWWTNIGGTGSNPGSFITPGQSFQMGPGGFPSATLTSTWALSGAATKLLIGDGVSPFTLTLANTSTLSMLASAKLAVLNTSTLVLQTATGVPALASFSLATGSTVDYAQSTLFNIYNIVYHNLKISGSADKAQTADVTVNGVLDIAAGRNYSMNINPSRALTLNGTISGSGTLRTNTGSNLIIGGSGTFGTLNFSAGTATGLNNLTINRTSGGTGITLGTNLTVLTAAAFTNGLFRLNGKALTLSGTSTFGSCTFGGSQTSTLNVNSTCSGSLLMDQTSANTRALNELLVNNAATNLVLGNAIDIYGTVTPSVGTITSGGNLTIKQNSTNKGRIGTISSGGFSGNVTAECYAPGPTTGWALLGAHGISGQTMNNWYSQFPMALEGSATGVMSAGGYFESVQGWNEADAYGYDTTITVSTALTPGQGFWVYLGDGQFTTSDFTISLTGSPVTGSLNIPLTNSAQSGTCLIANPFASPISWTALRNGNSAVANAVYIYNANGPYASFVGGVGTNGGSDVIPSGQGFYVEAVSNTNLVALETNKIASNTNLMKTNNAVNSNNIGLPIKLNINGFSGDFDETVIRFHGSTTNAFDIEWDARKIFQTPGYVGYPGGYSKYTTISTKGGNADYSINSLPYALTQNAVIPVLVKVMATGQYTITGQDMQLLPPGACVTLKDKLLNVTHNIKASPYVCTISDTTSAARFELTVCADVTTGINDNNSIANSDLSVNVKHDLTGIDVDLNFDKTTVAKISVTNILGQKIVENKKVTTQNETVHFGLEAKNQLLFITVETENNKITKKIIH